MSNVLKLTPVSFEQAKRLKELGFPQLFVNVGYYEDKKLHHSEDPYREVKNLIAVAPSLELVAKWLREEKNIHICPIYYSSKTYKTEWYSCEVNQHQINNDEEYSTYEEALIAGIDIAIKELTKV